VAIRTRTLKNGRRAYDVVLRRPDGSQYSTTFHTRREAETWEAQQKADRSRHRWVDPSVGRIPFKEYAEEWLQNRPNLRPRTVELYRSQLRRHLVPAFGHRSLIDITKRDVRTWHAGLARSRSETTAAKCYRLLATIMNTAVDDELIPSSPCRIKGAATERAVERPLLSIDDVFALADAIEPRYRALILIAAFCGLRLGELLGLTRADVDLLHRRLSVTKQLQQVTGGGFDVSAPKTAAGVRSVAIPSAIVADLQRHLAMWDDPDPAGAFFLGPRGGLRRATFYNAWRSALSTSGVREDIRPHDLRHLANTLAAQVPGTTSKDLMVRMGHKSSQAALRYLHASDAADLAISDGIDSAIRAVKSADVAQADRTG
jgi:integrase